MDYRIPYSKYYYRSEDNSIYNVSGVKVPVQDGKLKIYFQGRTRELYFEWVKYLAIYNIYFPKYLANRIFSVRFARSNGKHFSDEMIVYSASPIPLPHKPEYRLLVRYPDYAINAEGVIINVKTMEVVNFRNSNPKPSAYYCVTLYCRYRKRMHIFTVHRLVALAWVKNKDWDKFQFVNHIDGNKHNNYSNNLEWVTLSENIQHAYDNNLNNNKYVCHIRNIDTGKEYACKSIIEACEIMGRRFYSQGDRNVKPYDILQGKHGRFEFKHDNEDRDWYYKGVEFNYFSSVYNSIYLITEQSGKKICYPSHAIIAKVYLNLDVKGRQDSLMESLPTLTKGRVIKYEIIREPLSYNGIEIKDYTTNEIHYANNIKEAAEITGLKENTINKALKADMYNKLYNGKFVLRLAGDERYWPRISSLTNIGRVFVVKNKITNEVIETNNLTEVERITGRFAQVFIKQFKITDEVECGDYIVTRKSFIPSLNSHPEE